ncbi:MAG: DUF1439 domain-containing protein [Gammaproteobacteria bacterium]|nr:DUF1439 domain-containing protein [Gammaproteobacteria bacterium]MBU1442398.1 DUF1439 domain-containing protein [Gammaproteobacteria bacterium]MBU2409691.1 DUF1439 domain-containing protein [Gammaproteobacteria bacterium]
MPRLPSSPCTRRRALSLLAAALAVPASSGAMAGFNFFTSEYTATREELQAQIDKRFPVQSRYAELFTVSLRQPKLELDPIRNRAAITALLTIQSPLIQPPKVDGIVSVSSALKYDAESRALRLERPKAERIEIHGLEGRDAERLQQIGGVVAQELLRNQPLRTFTEKELTVGRKSYVIGEITVEDDGIKVQLL